MTEGKGDERVPDGGGGKVNNESCFCMFASHLVTRELDQITSGSIKPFTDSLDKWTNLAKTKVKKSCSRAISFKEKTWESGGDFFSKVGLTKSAQCL